MLTVTEKNLSNEGLQDDDSKRMLAIIQFARAQALSRLGALGDTSHLSEAEQLFSELLASPDIGLHAHSGLIELLIDQERYPEADRHIRSAIEKWPDEVTFYQEKFWSELLGGDMEAAAGTAKEVSDRQGNNDDALFLAALNQILTGRGQWELAGRKFLTTRHPYVDYVTMMLYARLVGPDKEEARRLLWQRWDRIKSHTWTERCRAGDASVWREMLIGHYVGAVTSEEIFGKLEDETRYRQSDLRHLPLPRCSMLCEAYFYDAMLAKVQGDAGRMRRQLNKVLDTGKRNYLEYKMAKYLLATEPVQRAES
jgi:tetratricopeptide (TPR) repeat protein